MSAHNEVDLYPSAAFVEVNTGLNRELPIPLYFQVSEILRRQIRSGQYLPGDQIPTEMELKDHFQVSRSTIRQAIAELVYQGLLVRRRSRGTIVAKTPLEETLYELGSFSNELARTGHVPSTRILSFKTVQTPEAIAEFLELGPEDKVAFMERVRLADRTPVAVEKWYAALKYVPGLNRKWFKESGPEQSTYYVLHQHCGIEVLRARDTMISVGLEGRDARLLELEAGTPVLLRTRVSYDAEYHPVTYSTGVFVNKLNITLEASRPGPRR